MGKIFKSLLYLLSNQQGMAGLLDGGEPAGAGAESPADSGTADAGQGDQGAGGEGGQEGQAADPFGEQERSVDFPDGIEDEIKQDPALKPFIDEQEGKLNYSNLLKSYVHAQRKMGADKVVVPGKNSSDEEWAQFYNKLRDPNPENYEIKPTLPEGMELDENFFNEFKTQAHSLGIMPKQAQQLFEWYNGKASEIMEGQTQQTKQQYEQEVAGLKKEWGEGFDNQLNLARQTLNHFVTPEEKQVLADKGLLNDVQLTKLMAKIGEGLKEDTFTQESKGGFGLTPEQAQSEVNKIMDNRDHAYWNKQAASHNQAVEEVNKLMNIAYSANA